MQPLQLSKPSNRYGLHALLRNALPLFALLWLAPHLADRWASAPWLLCPLIGLCIYRLTVVMHDCTHSTLFVGRNANKVAGSILGAITAIDFASFKRQHWQHHRSYGTRDDPQGFHYVGVKAMGSRAFVWHLLKPLLGLNLRHAFPESILTPRNLSRLARSGELLIIIGVQGLMLALVTGFGRHPLLLVVPALSASTFGLFFSQLRGIAEHGAVGEVAEAGNVRSHEPNWLDAILLYDVAFNYHAEHHARPDVPSRHLRALHATMRADDRICRRSMFATLRDIHESLRPSNG